MFRLIMPDNDCEAIYTYLRSSGLRIADQFLNGNSVNAKGRHPKMLPHYNVCHFVAIHPAAEPGAGVTQLN